MSKTEEEIYNEFLKEYKITDEIDKEYYRNSVTFASYLLMWRGREFAEALEKEFQPIDKALKIISQTLKKD